MDEQIALECHNISADQQHMYIDVFTHNNFLKEHALRIGPLTQKALSFALNHIGCSLAFTEIASTRNVSTYISLSTTVQIEQHRQCHHCCP